ncbi:GATA zinc finger domain-containing protein 1 [Orchesella cincta]|uniref:GATA zinc finger domain-containing protein 1 n=1 Tax=Orchesella cincta TaxID=48709 RepID=A0A1D2NKI6_ORCCI|nr:GATA zinc finger domain-containing protein 1 [Orchesella cincta]
MDQNRPKTRGLEATEAEEDAKIIKAALKEPTKVVIKTAHQKLRKDYGGKGGDSSDEEEKLFRQQPPYEDDTDVKPVRRKRGGGRRGNPRKRIKLCGDGEVVEEYIRRPISARLAALLKEEAKPKVVPCSSSTIEYKQVWYRLGDIVSLQKTIERRYYAQIVGFHTDQFCERYASIVWLIPKYKIDEDNPENPPLTADSFKASIPEEKPISMNCLRFVLRPPAHHFQPQNPHTVTRNRFFVYNNRKHFFDSPTPTLTSAEKRY